MSPTAALHIIIMLSPLSAHAALHIIIMHLLSAHTYIVLMSILKSCCTNELSLDKRTAERYIIIVSL